MKKVACPTPPPTSYWTSLCKRYCPQNEVVRKILKSGGASQAKGARGSPWLQPPGKGGWGGGLLRDGNGAPSPCFGRRGGGIHNDEGGADGVYDDVVVVVVHQQKSDPPLPPSSTLSQRLCADPVLVSKYIGTR